MVLQALDGRGYHDGGSGQYSAFCVCSWAGNMTCIGSFPFTMLMAIVWSIIGRCDFFFFFPLFQCHIRLTLVFSV